MELKNKKIFVTGADGFIGSHLVELLTEKGARVKALSHYNSFNTWGWLEDCSCLPEIEVITGDIRDAAFVRRITLGSEIIFHLAALIAIPYSYTAPQSYVETNVIGTLNLCQAALENNCEKIIHTSTSEVYGTARTTPISEDHPLQPQSPYSASKIAADAIAMSFFHSFNLPLVIARPFNTYGPRQSARAVIPSIITQILAGKKVIKLGNLSPTRDFSYVRDIVKGMALLIEQDLAAGETINIGSGREISIVRTIDLIKQLMAAQVEIESEKERIRPQGSEVDRLLCDNAKITELAGYKPAYSLKDGLKKTIDWFGQNLEKYKHDIYNI